MVGTIIVMTLLAARPVEKPVCVQPSERSTIVEELPPSWDVELVGVFYDPRGKSSVVVRSGKQRDAMSNVYARGERIRGRIEIVTIAPRSALVRVDGKLHVLRLHNRAVRDWAREVAMLPDCPPR